MLTPPLTGSAAAALTLVSVDAMADRSWGELEQPILEAVAALEDGDLSLSNPQTVAETTGLPLERVRH